MGPEAKSPKQSDDHVWALDHKACLGNYSAPNNVGDDILWALDQAVSVKNKHDLSSKLSILYHMVHMGSNDLYSSHWKHDLFPVCHPAIGVLFVNIVNFFIGGMSSAARA